MSVVPAEKKLTEQQVEDLAHAANIETNVLKSFMEVEGGGIGFSDVTGRMIIRFEKTWFQRKYEDWKGHQGAWEQTIVNQSTAWAAFSDAYNIDKDAALLSTSVGILQIMGFNHEACNFKSAEDMWAFNEISEINQVETGIRFIMSNPALYRAVKNKNWSLIALLYNGAGYREYAVKNNTIPYDRKMANAYIKFSNDMPLHKTTTTVNLRKGSGTNYDIIRTLLVNTSVEVKNVLKEWQYVKVIATGEEGWVNSKFVS